MLTVRPATLSDVESLVEGNLRMAKESESVSLDPAILRQGVRAILEGRAPGRYWAAETDGRVVGQLLITYEWSDWRNCMVWWIQSVHVAPDMRRRGVFKALYARVRREARAEGAAGLRLYVDNTNHVGQAVYATLGMRGDHYRVFEDMFELGGGQKVSELQIPR